MGKQGGGTIKELGIPISLVTAHLLHCDICNFGQDKGTKCVHPEGAAIKKYQEQPAGFNRGTFCANWCEDYPIKIPLKLKRR